jgi:streptogramin lyase
MRNDYIIRKIASDRAVTTLAGSPGIPGTADGPAETARFELPWAVAVDEKRNVYVADGQTIRKIDPSGVVTTLAGSAGKEGSTDGTGSAARFVNLHGIAVDSAGNVYVADAGNRNVRKITPAGVVKTLRDPRNRSPFVEPVGVAVDDKGHVYVADEDAFSIVVGKPAR